MNIGMNPGKDPARWEQRYLDDDIPWDSDQPDMHLRRVLDSFKVGPCKVLDIGCGTGTDAIWLDKLGFEVVGVDLSPTAIKQARAKAEISGSECTFQAADFLVDPIPGGPFKFVYDRGCLHIFDKAEDRGRFASRVAGLLEPQGLWHCLLGSTDGPPRDTGPPRRSLTEVAADMEPYFEILEVRSSTFDADRHLNARAWVVVARRRSI